MNLRLALASLHLPARVRRRKLVALLQRSAQAFGVDALDVRDQSPAECLRTFAAFSNVQAERALDGDAAAVAARLRAAARELGEEVRRELHVRGPREAMRAAWLLYRALGIDFDGRTDGDISIRGCYFADWYSPRVCAFMSALDEGVLAGLLGEGRLEFSRRITAGGHRCHATFHLEGKPVPLARAQREQPVPLAAAERERVPLAPAGAAASGAGEDGRR